ncbi:uncharacterized protein ARMOST_17724 [Armillaria ostoyae]|uniref:RING-type domain-containing protein n=1 Tax=Armillaria ostoyae TaxID=47428 RepID=A0A284RZS8_ARMOS|nr:uncharacterized protein ARMOST_17724 [Armillaria ostoyae]
MSSIFDTREPPHVQPRRNSQVVETIHNVADEVWRLEQQAHAKALYDLEQARERILVLHDEALTWRAVQRTTYIRGQQEINDLKEEIEALKLEVLLPASQRKQNSTTRSQMREKRNYALERLHCSVCTLPNTDACVLECGHTSHAPCLKEWFDTVSDQFEEDFEDGDTTVLTLKCMWCNAPVVNAPLRNYLVESAASGLPDARNVDHPNWSARWSRWWHFGENMNTDVSRSNTAPEEEAIAQPAEASLGDGESNAGRAMQM